MGHKVHPNAFRLGVFRPWEANWFANPKDYTKMLHEDLEMRRVILARLRNAGIAKIETERSSNAQLTVTIHTAKPGIVIGKGGASVDQLREDLEKRFGNRVRISIQEIKQPELDAQLVAENIASQIERRISYKRAMKQAILRTMRAGAKGVRIYCGGRLRGAEMARREWDREGRVPLHTLRANIDFGRATASTTFGAIGVKCWIYKDLAVPLKKLPVTADGAPIADQIAPQPEILEAIADQLVPEKIDTTLLETAKTPAIETTAAPKRATRPATAKPAVEAAAAPPKARAPRAKAEGATQPAAKATTAAKAPAKTATAAKGKAETKAAPKAKAPAKKTTKDKS
ncbi:MAG TPA: 30S ribosomal protein S3 [Candidatus Micrarchaeaceae archaeon]|nr:30S ribosomal protein S3 [Candidatus Micrarchaeaceae archaeon]